jgi:hypothetical protein
MPELTDFQDAFSRALDGDFAALAPFVRDGQDAGARFSVYRNTVAKGCADALAAQFPAVLAVVGEDWMREAGVRFAREHPPVRPSLMDYGAAFPDWLADFAPAADMPFLADLARIDWAWRDALFARDEPTLDPAAAARLSPERFAEVCAGLHPAARILWFDRGVPALWAALRSPVPPAEAELSDAPQGVLVARPALEVGHRLLGAGAFALLDACRAGLSLAAAATRALVAQPNLPLAATFADLIAAGAFARLTPVQAPETTE